MSWPSGFSDNFNPSNKIFKNNILIFSGSLNENDFHRLVKYLIPNWWNWEGSGSVSLLEKGVIGWAWRFQKTYAFLCLFYLPHVCSLRQQLSVIPDIIHGL